MENSERCIGRSSNHCVFLRYVFRRRRFGDKILSVAVTPNGYADAINGDYFAMPEERKMSFQEFLDILKEPQKHNGKNGDSYNSFFHSCRMRNCCELFFFHCSIKK